jgi:CHRD domain-containing protein
MVNRVLVVGTLATLLAACTPDRPEPTALEFRAPLFAVGGNFDFNLGTHMAGSGEVFTPAVPGDPTPADSRAQGEAIFRVSADGETVKFQLIASNIDNVIMSHIHCGRPGQNGPIRMWLYPVIGPSGAPGPNGAGRHDGVLASGTFSPTGVICPASAVGQDMPLLDAIRAGLTYVNVHTNDGVAPTNTGPGDFPGGEIRGQLDHPNQ